MKTRILFCLVIVVAFGFVGVLMIASASRSISIGTGSGCSVSNVSTPSLPSGFNTWLYIRGRGSGGSITNFFGSPLTYNSSSFGIWVYMVKPFSPNKCPIQYLVDFSDFIKAGSQSIYIRAMDNRTNLVCDSIAKDNIHCFGGGEVGIFNLILTKQKLDKIEVTVNGTLMTASMKGFQGSTQVVDISNIAVTFLDYKKE